MARTQIDNSLLKSLAPTFIGLGRNRVINGDMRIDQVSAGASTSITGGGTQFTLDMFASLCSAGSFSVQRQTATPPTGFTHYMRLTTTSATASPAAADYFFTQHWIEGNNVRDFLFGSASAKTVTLSFWVRSSLTGNFGAALDLSTSARSYPFSYTISAANTWEQKSVTIIGDTTGGFETGDAKSMRIIFDHGTGTDRQGTANTWATSLKTTPASQTRLVSTASATWDLTGLQLELGTIATLYEFRPQQVELILCQRYYEKSYNIDTAIGTATGTGAFSGPGAITNTNTVRYGAIWFKVTKRTDPTVTIWNSAGTSGAINTTSTTDVNTSRTADVVTPNTNSFGVRQAVTSADLYCGVAQWAATARMS